MKGGGVLNYIEQEHIEVCQLEISNENAIYYLPHHAVKLNETKFQMVFDASSYDPGMPSLNDTLEVGPNLLPSQIPNTRDHEVLHYTTATQCLHFPGIQNPAEHLSRGIVLARLSTLNLGWNRPEWLKEPKDNLPERYSCEDLSLTITEARKVKTRYLCTTSVEPTINVSHFNSYLISNEYEKANLAWIRTVQQQCFAVEVNSLKNAKLSAKSFSF
ncbi:uncharacterized protein TNCV_4449261 [Trichonephila clavipes]|nr:uncharacterized protein TNCV_4449261 [Trichonephila clavipes]